MTTHAPPDLNGWGADTAERAGSPEPDQGTTTDAPFGFTTDGRPKTSRRGRPRKGSTSSARSSSSSGPKAPPRTRSSSSRKPPQTDYATSLNGMLQLVGVPLAMKYPLDGAALAVHGPPVCEALSDLANQDPRLAAVLDKLLQVGPYGALLTAVVPLVAQLCAHHGVIPVELAGMVGALPPDELLRRCGVTVPAPAPAYDDQAAAGAAAAA